MQVYLSNLVWRFRRRIRFARWGLRELKEIAWLLPIATACVGILTWSAQRVRDWAAEDADLAAKAATASALAYNVEGAESALLVANQLCRIAATAGKPNFRENFKSIRLTYSNGSADVISRFDSDATMRGQ